MEKSHTSLEHVIFHPKNKRKKVEDIFWIKKIHLLINNYPILCIVLENNFF